MEDWKKILKIVLPIAVIIILVGAYFYFRQEEESANQLLNEGNDPRESSKTQEQIIQENEQKATADGNFVPKPEDVSNAQITPSNSDALDIEPDPGVINKLSAPE